MQQETHRPADDPGLPPLPTKWTTDMRRARRAAIALLGPFPVADELRCDRPTEKVGQLDTPLPEIRNERQATAGIDKIIQNYAWSRERDRSERPPAALIAYIEEIARDTGSLARKLQDLTMVERSALHSGMLSGWMGHGALPFPDQTRMKQLLTEQTGALGEDIFLKLQVLLPPFSPHLGIVSQYPNGPLVNILLRLSAYARLLARQLAWDLSGSVRRRGDVGNGTLVKAISVERAKWGSPAMALADQCWSIFARCPNVRPSGHVARSERAATGRSRATVQELMQLLHTAATGEQLNGKLIAPNMLKKVARLWREESRLQYRRNDLYLRGDGYSAQDLWAAAHLESEIWLGPTGSESGDPSKVPPEIAAEATAIGRRLLEIHVELHAPEH